MEKKITKWILGKTFFAVIAFAGVPTMSVSATNTFVTIAQTDAVATIKTNIQNAINVTAIGDTITVIGSKTNVDTWLGLTIPSGKRVIWKAEYETVASMTNVSVYLDDAGTFEVAENGKIITTNGVAIRNDMVSNAIIIVSGGTVSSTAAGSAIQSAGILKLTSGTVSATTGIAISAVDIEVLGTVTVSNNGAEDPAIYITSSIKMNDAAKLTLKNGSTVAETHTFEKSVATSTYQWKLTNATLSSGNPADASISVSVAAGQTGTVERVSTTAVENVEAQNLKIYPNPVKDELRIESGELRIDKVEICDLTGKTVYQFDNLKNEINVSALSQGIYIVKLKTDKGTVTEKFIKE